MRPALGLIGSCGAPVCSREVTLWAVPGAAERGHVVLTSDPDDVAAVNPRLALIAL